MPVAVGNLERCLACEAVVNKETASHNVLTRAVLYRFDERDNCREFKDVSLVRPGTGPRLSNRYFT